jgi:hypothetical protein
MNTGKASRNAYLSDKGDAPMRLKQVEGAKATYGRACLLKLLKGSKLTRRESQAAFCCECMGLYADKVCDCEMCECPMYEYMPYRKDRKRPIRKDRR